MKIGRAGWSPDEDRVLVLSHLPTNLTHSSTHPFAAMKIGPAGWSPNEDKLDVGQREWKLLVSGFNYAVWEAVF